MQRPSLSDRVTPHIAVYLIKMVAAFRNLLSYFILQVYVIFFFFYTAGHGGSSDHYVHCAFLYTPKCALELFVCPDLDHRRHAHGCLIIARSLHFFVLCCPLTGMPLLALPCAKNGILNTRLSYSLRSTFDYRNCKPVFFHTGYGQCACAETKFV